MLKSIEQERDYYKKENDKLRKKGERMNDNRAMSPTRSSAAKTKEPIPYESKVRFCFIH